MRGLPIPIVVAAFVLVAPLSAEWRYYASPHFELYSERTKAISETLLHQLELTRELLLRLNGDDNGLSRTTRIVAFRSERSFQRQFPAAGPVYVLSASVGERDLIAFHKPYYYSSYQLVTHQYLHFRTNESKLPTWLSEGLAEYYSTVYSWGGKIRVGKPPQTIPREGVGAWPSLGQLFDAPEELFAHVEGRAEQGNPRFAKSWELVRMLMLHPAYKDGFQDVVAALTAGERAEVAFQAIFGKDLEQVQTDLAAFANQPATPGAAYPTEWRASEYPISRRSVDRDEAIALLAELSAALN